MGKFRSTNSASFCEFLQGIAREGVIADMQGQEYDY